MTGLEDQRLQKAIKSHLGEFFSPKKWGIRGEIDMRSTIHWPGTKKHTKKRKKTAKSVAQGETGMLAGWVETNLLFEGAGFTGGR